MTVKTCLLVSDDPDDHQGFSEASAEISDGALVLIILDSQKAIHLLQTKTHKFDFIFLDLSMHGIRINSFLKIVKGDDDLREAEIVVYGDEANFTNIENRQGLTFFKKDYEYTELRDFLKRFFAPPAK